LFFLIKVIMASLPLIVGIGGINAAGRTSGFHGYKRLVCEVLSPETMNSTWRDLAHRMGIEITHGISEAVINKIKAGTLTRRIETFDPSRVGRQFKGTLKTDTTFILRKSKLPAEIPHDWKVKELDAHCVEVTLLAHKEVLLSGYTPCSVSCGGGLPSGFNPGTLYNSHHHPRGLSLAIYGASDALNSLGLAWDDILKHIHPDEVSVYAGSALAQIDSQSLAGLIGEPLRGNRINSKMMPMSLAEMPADFINSYVINSVGQTGTQVGACASFLYNLKQGMIDIQTGRAKVVIVGNAEAPLVPEVMEGFSIMGALANDESLRTLDGVDQFDERRSCRPFSNNTGFTMAEGAQFVVLMEDQLALKLGAPIYGSVADVFIHADGNKKSISKPGVGNYLTFAKATALARAMLGEKGLQQTYVQAHGTGTPQNRVTESHLLNLVAKTFGIKRWPVAAVKAYVGHTIAAAAGDQLMAALGVWRYGYIPGIKTIDHIAHDVHRSHLRILTDHEFVGEAGQNCPGVLINSKGFGGNNATALVLSPHQTQTMLLNKYGSKQLLAYEKKNEKIQQQVVENDHAASEGHERIFYDFGTQVMDEADLTLTQSSLTLSGFERAVELPSVNPYEDY
jgi:acetoacetyl-[acyl-carrier protein] synthase